MHFLFPTRVIIYLKGPQISHKIWAPTESYRRPKYDVKKNLRDLSYDFCLKYFSL